MGETKNEIENIETVNQINEIENDEEETENITGEENIVDKKHTFGIVRNTLSIVVLIVAIISIFFNVSLVKDIIEKNKTIRLNAYNYTDNLVDYSPTLITEISQVLVDESVQSVETETDGKYTGSRVDGKKSGTGKYVWNNGDVYEGEFSNDLMHGTGKLTIVGQGTYEGEFVQGKKSGEGTFTFANGDVYKGDWVDDKMEGSGEYKFANGDVYKGTFSNNKFNGNGTYKKDGKSYTGTWKDNVYNQ